MPEARHLRNAPIIEALIDFRIKARPDFRPEEFENLARQLAPQFPKAAKGRGVGLEATINKDLPKSRPPIVRDLGVQAYRFLSADEKTIAQFKVDGFTFNRLRPYTRWEELFPQAMALWHRYCGVAKPEVITRLAVRYINRLPIPSTDQPFETYLRAAPSIPEELPQYVSSFLTRTTIHDPKTDISANVAQALEAVNQPQLTVILDIDVYKQSEFVVDDPEIEPTFKQLRDFKNLIFFNSITEAMLEQFE